MKTLLALMLLAQGAALTRASNGEVAGQILSMDGTPAVGVRVAASAIPNTLVQGNSAVLLGVTQTDSSGHYRLADIPPGRYYIVAGLVEAPTYFPGVRSPGDAAVVTVAAGAVTQGKDFRMAVPRPLKVAGKVIRETGTKNQLAGGAMVTLRASGGTTSLRAGIASDGSFEFMNVQPGNYQAVVFPDGIAQPGQILVVDQDVTGLRLVAPGTDRITGTVTVEGTGVLPGFIVTFVRINGSSIGLPLGMKDSGLVGIGGAGGRFTVELPLGEYILASADLPEGYFIKSPSIFKVAPDTSQIAITLGVSTPPWVKVTGRVTGFGAVDTRSLSVSISSNAAAAQPASVNPDGSFEFPRLLPGVYFAKLSSDRVNSACLLCGWRKIVVGKTDLADVELPFSVPVFSIEGRVTGDIVKQLGPNEVIEIGARGEWANAGTSAGPDGTFMFPVISPGPYTLTAIRRPRGNADGAFPMIGQSTIVVTTENITRLEIAASNARPAQPAPVSVSISGVVATESLASQPRFQLLFLPRPPRTVNYPPPVLVSGRTFAAELRPSEYRVVAAGLPSGYSIRSMTAGATDLLAGNLLIAAGDSPRISVTVGVSSPAPWVKVSGRASGSNLTPTSTIILRSTRLIDPLTVPVGPGGSFEFPSVLPDTYSVDLVPTAPDAGSRTIVVGSSDIANLEINFRGSVGDFATIQPGDFEMGCASGDINCESDETPAHSVRITKGFEIGKYEVTQKQWQAVMGTNPSGFKGDNRPVENVSWTDAQEFLNRLNARSDGYRYRLPTEAEWEYAARAGTTTVASATPDAVRWYERNSGLETHPVGQTQQNAWGLYDMLGNIAEWVEDWYDAATYPTGAVSDPRGPASGFSRVVRGGSWVSLAALSRVSTRDWLQPSLASDRVGLRIVREPTR